MANVWAGDPNIISVWNFESGALTVDSVGSNTLTAVNTPQEDVVDYKQGACCTALAYASKRYFKITDASLSAGFPLKNGGTIQRMTFGCWFKLNSTGGNVPAIVGKSAYVTGGISLYHSAGSLRVNWHTTAYTIKTVSTGVWYHIAVCLDGRARTCYIRLYESDVDTSTTYIMTPPATDPTLTYEFRVGAWSGTDADRTFDGKIDEVFVFSRLLSYAEIDAIRNGSFEYVSPSVVSANDYSRDRSVQSVYHFESGALTTDAQGKINLTAVNTPVVNTVDYKVGSGCVEFSYRDNQYYKIVDADLPIYWPLKGGTSSRFWTICCWVKTFDFGATNKAIWGKWLTTGTSYSAILYLSSVTRNLHVSIGYGSSTTGHDTGIPMYPNEWYHVSVFGDGASDKAISVRVYRESTSEIFADRQTLGSSYSQTVGTAEFRIGGHQQTPAESWNGLIDEFVVFNRACTVTELDAIRSGTYKGPIKPPIPDMSNIPAVLGIPQAVNKSSLTFTLGGDSLWDVENNETHDGSFSAKSGSVSTDQESWMSTVVHGPGALIFWWAVDSTADHHYLQFQIDDVEQHKITGPNNPGAWEMKTYSITSGEHTLKWRYYTDGTATSNRNAGWVDEISFITANDFTGDSSCKAFYKFENNVAMGYDSIGSNHLIDGNCIKNNIYQFKDGYQSAEFNRDNAKYFRLDDSDLDAGFPLKNGDATKTGTWCFWVYFKTLSNSVYYDIISKGSTTNRCLDLYYYNGLCCNWGYSGGNQTLNLTSYGLTANRWYHISFSFDGVSKRIYLRVWDDELQQIIFDQVWSPTNAMVTSVDNFRLGAYSGNAYYLTGLLDEVVIFDRELPSWQIDAIRKGLYSGTGPTQPGNDFTSDSSCKALWRFEDGSKTTDSISTNTLTDHSTTQITDAASYPKEGSGYVQTANSAATWLHIPDSSLAAGFPLKDGDTNKVISVCLWFRPFDIGNYRTAIAKNSSSAGSFFIQHNSSGNMYLRYCYVNGTQDYQIATGLTTYHWYHLGFTIDGINRKVTWRLYDSYYETATYGECYPGAELRVDTTDWTIGAYQGASTGTAANAFYGGIDEVVVFNRLLDIIEIDAIRQGKYSGTGLSGVAVDYMGAQLAYRSEDRQTYFCIDPNVGFDIANDGLSYDRPWRSHKGKFYAPGDTITFPKSDLFTMSGTVTVTHDSMTVTTTANLTGILYQYDVITFGSDNVLYTIYSITPTTISLYRPYRGSSASGVTLYKVIGIVLTDWYAWNSGGYDGYPDQPIRLLCGVNTVTGEQEGWSLFDYQGNRPATFSNNFLYVSRYAGYNSANYAFSTVTVGSIFEDIYCGYNHWWDFTGIETVCNRLVFEASSYMYYVSYVTDCTINDLEMFGWHNYNLYLQGIKNTVFNRFRTGGSAQAINFQNQSDARDVIFYNPVCDEGIAHTRLIYFTNSSFCNFANISLVNASFNPSTPLFAVYATGQVQGDISFAHYNQTQDDNRSFIFRGIPTTTYAAAVYRDTSTFRTSAPSVRIELPSVSPLPIKQEFFVPGAGGTELTISCYVRINEAYLSNYYTLPSLTVRCISGSSPNFIWVDSIASAFATADTWQLLSVNVTPSITSVLEVIVKFQSISSDAVCWIDDLDVQEVV